MKLQLQVKHQLKKRRRKWRCDVLGCTLKKRHSHCTECGATTHGAAYCDNLG